MLPQGLMVISRRLHPEDDPLQPILVPERLRLGHKPPKPLKIIPKNQPPQKRLPPGRPKKGIVLLFGDIDSHQQILARSPNFFPELTKFFQSATIHWVHKKPPVKMVLGCGTLSYHYRRFPLSKMSDTIKKYFFLCHPLGCIPLSFLYITISAP